jgi:hypothetical protein
MRVPYDTDKINNYNRMKRACKIFTIKMMIKAMRVPYDTLEI